MKQSASHRHHKAYQTSYLQEWQTSEMHCMRAVNKFSMILVTAEFNKPHFGNTTNFRKTPWFISQNKRVGKTPFLIFF